MEQKMGADFSSAEPQEPSVKMVDRVVGLLRVLATADIQGLTITELAQQAGLSKATAHRLVSALVEVGYAFQDLNSKRYQLGTAAVALGQSAVEHVFRTAAQPALARLAEATGDTVLASIREGAAAVCVARVVGSFPIRTLTLDVGDRRPLGVGSGSLALLAALPDAQVEEALRRNIRWLEDYQGFTRKDVLADVAKARKLGFAQNDGRIVTAMSAVAVAVTAADGRVLGALSIAAINDRMGPDRVPELVGQLKQEALLLAKELGSAMHPSGND